MMCIDRTVAIVQSSRTIWPDDRSATSIANG